MNTNELNVLWTNADPITAEHMVFLYVINAKKRNWFEEVRLIIWGQTATLVAENDKIKLLVKEALEAGVKVEACLACAKSLGVEETLRHLGITLAYMGQPLTEILKSKAHLLTI